MIKKIIVFIILFISTLINVNAQNDDVLTIELFDSNIIIAEENEYSVKNEYDTLIMFGKNPQENYFYKLFKNKYVYQYNNEKHTSNIDYLNINVTTKNEYGFNSVEDGDMLYVGNRNRKFNERENIKIEFYSVLDKKENGLYSYTICEEEYDVKKINFLITMASGFEGKELKFSLDNKSYSKELSNLQYKIEKDVFAVGSYTSTLKKGESLSFILIDNVVKQSNNIQFYIIILSAILLVTVFVVLLKKRRTLTKHKKSI